MASNDNIDPDEDWEVISLPPRHHCHHRSSYQIDWLFLKLKVEKTVCAKDCAHEGHSQNSATKRDGAAESIAPPEKRIAAEPSTQSRSLLFKLPVELRMEIYEAVLTAPEGVRAGPKHTSIRPSILSILQTCRQIHAEAEEIYYGINRLEYRINSGSLSSLAPKRRDAITALTVYWESGSSSGGAALSAVEQVQCASNLESLWITLPLSIRFVNLSGWTLLERQICVALRKLKHLKELKILLPKVSGEMSTEEGERWKKLAEVIKRLQQSFFEEQEKASSF